MLSKSTAGKKIGDDSGNGRLLNEIEAISKALYVDKHPSKSSIPKPSSNAKPIFEDPQPRKDKKSIWNWRPLKAFSHIRNRRFDCCFSLTVHSVQNLPPELEGLSLSVHWKRRDGDLATRPAKVRGGAAEFEERLTITCSVYGSRSGPHHSAKYEAKHFLLYASLYGSPELDLGKHRVDLTKLLPVTLEELEDDKSSGKWTTSFNLSGKARGAAMEVSFGYSVENGSSKNNGGGGGGGGPDLSKLRQNNLSLVRPGTKYGAMRRADSLPSESKQKFRGGSRSVEDIKDLHEVLPVTRSELASSVDVLYKILEEESSDKQIDRQSDFDPVKPHPDDNDCCEDTDFSVTEHGVEEALIEGSLDVEVDTSAHLGVEERAELCSQEEKDGSNKDEPVLRGLTGSSSEDDDDVCTKESLMKELELALNSVSDLETDDNTLESVEESDNPPETKADYEISTMKAESPSLDDLTESIANNFLDMLGMEHSPSGLSSGSEADSPRERLLRQFEKETLSGGGFSLFGFDPETEDQAGLEWRDSAEDLEFSSIVQAAEEEHLIASQAERGKAKAKMLEDSETEALMREWGLNERAFREQYSLPPPKGSAGFGSPIDMPPPPEQPIVELPPLGDGLGPFLQTKNGGFLRSMKPSLFAEARNGGSLVMQVSSPVVVPAEMGSGVMDILQHLASVGIEKLSIQANKLMPLEDVTGKTMQQLAWEAMPSLEGPQSSECLLQPESVIGIENHGNQISMKERSTSRRSTKSTSSSAGNVTSSEYVSLEDLAPLAMDKIEALSIEGLRIQSGMSDEDAPSNITAKSIGEISSLQGQGVNLGGSLGLEGAGGLQLLDIKDGNSENDEVEGLMGLALTLDDWMRLDSGEIDEGDHISERTSKILAAHHAHSLDFIRGGADRRRGKGRKCGLLGNNFTVALMVQLRDPMRDYEPVGAPMLSLIQVERVFVPPKPRIYSTVSELRRRSIEDDDDDDDDGRKEEKKKEEKSPPPAEEQGVPQYRITEVHVAGLNPKNNAEPGKKKSFWGFGKQQQQQQQQQSGSRWLVANGMSKSNKNPLLKSKAAPRPSPAATSASASSTTTTKVQPGETLWSISSRVHGTGAKWKELAALNPHIRNPNVIFPNETIRFR